MRNILLVLRREYMVRVKKKSFIIMTVLTPLLIVGFYAAAIWVAVGTVDTKSIEILDESGLFRNKFENSESLRFHYTSLTLDSAKTALKAGPHNALVYIPADILSNPRSLRIYAQKNVSLELQSNIEAVVEKQIEDIKLEAAGITHKILEDARVNVKSKSYSLSDEGEKSSSSGAATIIGGILAFITYMSIFLYGTQVMRGVTEEKTSRIVEVIISSVKPFQLMMGKILGVGLVGLTQFFLWIMLTLIMISATGLFLRGQLPLKKTELSKIEQSMPSAGQVAPNIENPALEIIESLRNLNLPLIIGCFIFYYLGGYLLYSALFGAVGAAVDNDADTQQFMLPITLPVVFSFIFAQFVIRDPDGPMAFWTSVIPLTSPIIMMVRIPFGVPVWQLILSMTLLVAGFVGTTWLASKIYRVGILMYGKKVTYKELAKWIFYKN